MDKKDKVSTLSNALMLLEIFSPDRPKLGLSELAGISGLGNSAIQRLVHTLMHKGYLTRDEVTKKFSLSPRPIRFAFSYMHHNTLMKIATPHNVRLVSEFGLSSELAVLEGHDVVYLVRQTTHLENYSLPIVGERLPAVATASGLAILSCMAEGDYLTKLQELDSLKIWEQFGVNREDTLKKIIQAKSLRYIYQDDENILSEQSVAVALLGPGQTVLGAMSITGDRSKLEDLGLRKEIISRLQTTAKSISKMQLG